MRVALFPVIGALALAACVGGRISTIPMRIDGQEVWVYEGRANAGWQFDEAERMMSEHCWRVSRGRAVMVGQTSQVNGGFVNVTRYGAYGGVSRDQRVMFACEGGQGEVAGPPAPPPPPDLPSTPEPGSPERATIR